MKKMKKKIILAMIFLLILIGILSIFHAKEKWKEKNLSVNSFTKAICTEEKYCEDYEIMCEGRKIVRITPTGATIQFSNEWIDPRTKEDRKIICG